MSSTRKAITIAVTTSILTLIARGSSHAEGWRLAFEDNFDGNQLDPRKWATRYVYEDGTLARLNDEEQRYDDNANHRVANGALSLVARVAHGRADGARYDSGMVRSRQTFYYGYFEARVFLPKARGIWPAFWLNSDYTGDGRLGWPPEIDAFEYVINGTHETPEMIHSSVMVGKTGAQDGSWLYRDPAFNERWTYFRATKPLNEDWQVIGLLWKPDAVSMYLNGHKLYTRAYKWAYDDGEMAGPAHILLNLAVGGKWAGLNGVDDARFPQQLMVDYVRVCQYSRAAGGTDRCANNPLAPLASEEAYQAGAGDVPRTILLSAEASPTLVAPGARFSVKYGFQAVPTRNEHHVHSILVNDRGKEVAVISAAPPVPTSRWRGSQIVTQSMTVPANLPPGHYRLFVSVGAPVTGVDATQKNIPLAARENFGVADGRLRYRVADITVGEKSPTTSSPQRPQ